MKPITGTIMMVVVYIAALFMVTKASSAKGNIEDLIVGSPHLHTSSSFLRSRRQTTGNTAICGILAGRAICSSHYAQNVINAISKCGDRATDAIGSIETFCHKNENGEYCGEVLSYVNGNCSNTACSAGCSNVLRRAGCCSNDGNNNYNRYLTACVLPLPSPCARSNLRVPTIRQDDSCSSEADFLQTTVVASCDNVNPIINALNREDTCKALAEDYRAVCSSRNGQYCQVELNTTGSGGDSIGLQAINKGNSDCTSVFNNCSLQCKSSLNFVKTTVGCCIHSLNLSTSASLDPIYSSTLWKTCEISVPQKCGAASMTFKNFITFLAIIASLFLSGSDE